MMIRTFALAVALIATFGAIGYAQNMRGWESSSSKNPRAAAGQVNADGSVNLGTHFSVIHKGRGSYEIDFDETYFRSSCPVLTVTPVAGGNATSAVFQVRCRVYDVYLLSNGRPTDTAFDLIAMAAE